MLSLMLTHRGLALQWLQRKGRRKVPIGYNQGHLHHEFGHDVMRTHPGSARQRDQSELNWCLPLALFGHPTRTDECLLSGVKADMTRTLDNVR